MSLNFEIEAETQLTLTGPEPFVVRVRYRELSDPERWERFTLRPAVDEPAAELEARVESAVRRHYEERLTYTVPPAPGASS